MKPIVSGLQVLNVFKGNNNYSIEAQLGDAIGSEVESVDAQWIQHCGFASMPSKAVVGNRAAEAIVIKDTQRDVVIGSRDINSQNIYGGLTYGETCIYASGEDGNAQARILLKKDGSINLYTKEGNTSSGVGMGVFINAEQDSITIVNSQGYGIIIDGDGVRITAGGSGSAATFSSAGGIKIIGTGTTQVDGASIVLGSVAVPLVNSALKGPTGLMGTASLKVLIE